MVASNVSIIFGVLANERFAVGFATRLDMIGDRNAAMLLLDGRERAGDHREQIGGVRDALFVAERRALGRLFFLESLPLPSAKSPGSTTIVVVVGCLPDGWSKHGKPRRAHRYLGSASTLGAAYR